MNLNAYLVKHKLTTQSFAKKMGVSFSAVSKWRTKQRLPRAAMIAKMLRITKGKVRLTDWYEG